MFVVIIIKGCSTLIKRCSFHFLRSVGYFSIKLRRNWKTENGYANITRSFHAHKCPLPGLDGPRRFGTSRDLARVILNNNCWVNHMASMNICDPYGFAILMVTVMVPNGDIEIYIWPYENYYMHI